MMPFSRFVRPLILLSLFAQQTLASESLDDTINYLIGYVEKSKVTFIRNGQSHTPAEAADHIRAKYDHFKNKIKTPEDFIQLCASKSLLSGKPYLVHPSSGKEMHMDEWLAQALDAHRGSIH